MDEAGYTINAAINACAAFDEEFGNRDQMDVDGSNASEAAKMEDELGEEEEEEDYRSFRSA